MADDLTKTDKDLANVLLNMSFGKLMSVANELVSMVAEAEPPRKIDVPTGMAEMLYDWAESKIE
jgi:hypothetical protein